MKTPRVQEVNFDALVGPTHHFGGLSLGNLSSINNKAQISNPKKAALQGLEKMRFLARLGFKQCLMPPHERPHFKTLRHLGFTCSNAQDLAKIYEKAPELFSSVSSSSFMWAANAATVCPKSDALDNKTHLLPANLITMFHRSIEAPFATKIFKKIFHEEKLFHVHEALPAHDLFSDEGAANHNRLAPKHEKKGLQIFVYGKEKLMLNQETKNFPARQSREASIAAARLHKLDPDYFLAIPQNPHAIDSGAFHNDVVCVANEHVLLCHEEAFLNQKQTLKTIQDRYEVLFKESPNIIQINSKELSLCDAVSSYLFNSQLLTKTDGSMLLFAPAECLKIKSAEAVIDRLINSSGPINEVQYFDISESMANGGGPACLRLRVILTDEELANIKQEIIFSEELYINLQKIINKYYTEKLTLRDFFDNKFLDNSKRALDEISSALNLRSIYDFQ